MFKKGVWGKTERLGERVVRRENGPDTETLLSDIYSKRVVGVEQCVNVPLKGGVTQALCCTEHSTGHH